MSTGTPTSQVGDSPGPQGGLAARWELLLGALVGGALVGVFDALQVELMGLLMPSPARKLMLVSGDALLLALVAAVLVLPAALSPASWRARVLGHAGRWAGGVLGAVLVLLVDLTQRWLEDPPPFVELPAWRTQPALFLGGVAVALVLGWLIARTANRPVRMLVVGFFVGGLALRAGLAQPRNVELGPEPTDAPHVVVVSMDTTRADHFGAYGATEGRTPTFDALAQQGLKVELAVAPIAVTGPSHTTLFSGLGPWRHGNLLNGLPLPDGLPWLPEILRARGWRTAAFVSAYVLEGELGFQRGFEVYDDDFGWFQGWGDTMPGRLAAMVGRRLDPHEVLERRGEHTVDQALTWLEARAGESRPAMAWVHLFDPHGPYEPPPPWDTAFYEGDPHDPAHSSMAEVEGVAAYLEPSLEGITDVDWVLAQYQGEIAATDEQLARIVAWAEQQARPPLLVVVADHGESLGEHGVWFNHGDDLFEPGTRIPLVFWQPGGLPAGAVLDDPVELGDIAPTVLTQLGLEVPEAMEGRALQAQLEGADGRAFARSICFDRQANQEARQRGEIRQPTFRMVGLRGPTTRYVLRDAPGFGAAFYDLSADPSESREAPADPALLAVLKDEATAVLDAMSDEQIARSGSEVDEETRRRLEKLGYLNE